MAVCKCNLSVSSVSFGNAMYNKRKGKLTLLYYNSMFSYRNLFLLCRQPLFVLKFLCAFDGSDIKSINRRNRRFPSFLF